VVQPVSRSQNGATVELGRADADPATGRIEIEVTVPGDAGPGTASITLGHADPGQVEVVAP
jgi:hypothetical protein